MHDYVLAPPNFEQWHHQLPLPFAMLLRVIELLQLQSA
jgi:hypothetical protein